MAANRHSDNLAIWSHITSSLLASWINDKNIPNELLIIDSRDTDEYEQSHIKNSINLRNSKIMRKRLRSEKLSIIELLLRNTPFGLIENKHNINIVVYDAQSEHTNQLDTEKSFAFILLEKLAQKYKNVSFLTGGFVNFKLEQPGLVQSFQNLTTSSSSFSSNSTILNTDASFPSTCTSSTTTPISNFPFSTFETLTPPILNKNEKPSMITTPADSAITTKSENNRRPYLSKTTMRPSLNSSISSFNLITDAADKSKKNELTTEFVDEPPLTSASISSLQGEKIEEEENLIRQPTKILDFLYLGSQEDALSEPTMKALNITNVLNVSISCPKAGFIGEENFLRIPVNDGHVAKISPFFDIAFRFIEKCRKANNNVLIHCLAGISRSPTLAIAYLMKFQSLKSDEAYKFVKDRRPTISPNFNFLGQLYEYEKQQETSKKLNEASNVIQQNDTSNMPGLTFLKFTKKASFTSTISEEIDPTCSKEASEIEQRKKRFIFRFNDTPLSNDLLLPSPSQAFSNFNLNSPTTNLNHSNSTYTITGSPPKNEQTLKSFSRPSFSNIENPKSLGVFVPKSFTVNSLKDIYKDSIEKSSDNDFCKNDSTKPKENLLSGVVLRRPNILNMSLNKKSIDEDEEKKQIPTITSSKSVNTLKRPSSILLGFSSTAFSNFPSSSPLKSPQAQQNEVRQQQENLSHNPHHHQQQRQQQQQQQQEAFSQQHQSNLLLKDRKLGSIMTSTQFSVSSANSSSIVTPLTRTLSNTSASSSSSSCSCCSNVSSSSNSVSSFNQASPYVCNSCSNQQFVNSIVAKQQQQTQQEQQYQCQKKIKLSPIQDKYNFLSNFGLVVSANNALDSPSNVFKPNFNQVQMATTPTSSASFTSFGDVFQHHSKNNNITSTSNSKQLSSCNTQSLLSNEYQQSNSSINQVSNVQQEQINESKSFETIKSLMDQAPIQKNKSRLRSRNYEEDENFNSENDDENHKHSPRLMVSSSEERVLSNSSSLINLSSIQNSKMVCNSINNSNNAIQTKSSSSSSSSKNGSNKNSLHGSIETMIEVS